MGAGGTKLLRISPWARRSAIQVASFTSLSCPGIWRRCIALARMSSTSPSRIMPDRLPEDPGGFHRDVGHPTRHEPLRQGEQLSGRHAKAPHLMRDRACRRQVCTGDDHLLVYIEPGTPGGNDVHGRLLGVRAPAWSPRHRSLEGALSGRGPVAAVRGARGAPGPTDMGAQRTNAGPTSLPTLAGESTPFHAPGARSTGGN